MTEVPASKFLHIYGHLLISCWGSPALKKRFLATPTIVLKEFGLDPEGAKINIKKPEKGASSEQATPESQVALWNEGKKKGTIDFYFPEEPPETAANYELSDEELMAVAGGWRISCCCCTPCCCC